MARALETTTATTVADVAAAAVIGRWLVHACSALAATGGCTGVAAAGARVTAAGARVATAGALRVLVAVP
jgi:hypothetical protein